MEEGLLRLAERSFNNKRYDAACSVFIHLLRVLPTSDIRRRTRITDLLTAALCEWGSEADQLDYNSFELLMKAYHESLELLPTSAVLSNNVGGLLFRLGYQLESLGYFRRAVVADGLFLKAQENLDNASSSLVERWHFRMINDSVRNVAFHRAISAALDNLEETSGDLVVLDIGTGSGILSLFAAEAIESKSRDSVTCIYGCDSSRVMSQMAVDIVSQSRYSQLINIINKKSTELQCPQDFPAKAHVMLTETFDSGLLGEHILNTLNDAWARLIDTDCESIVIPCGASVYLTAVESDSIRLQNRYIGEVMCVNMDSVHIVCSTNCVHCTVTNSVESQHSQVSSAVYLPSSDGPSQTEYLFVSDEPSQTEYSSISDEPYTSEKLSRLRSGFTFLSVPSVVVKFNFNNRQEVCSYAGDGHQISFNVDITSCGRLDALALWFDLHLYGDVTVTSSPQGRHQQRSGCDVRQASCWEQAVYPIMHTSQGSLSDVMVHCGDVLNIHCVIQSALRITRCRLLRTDNNKYRHHHLDSCSHSHKEPITSDYQELQPTDGKVCHGHHGSDCGTELQHSAGDVGGTLSENSLPDPVCDGRTDNSHHHHHRRRHGDVDCFDHVNEVETSRMSVPLNVDWFHVDRVSIGLLNDVVWVESCLKALRQLINCQAQQQMLLIISCQAPFMFPIAALRLGLVSNVCFIDLDPVHRPLIGRLLAANDVSEDHVTFGRPWQRDVTGVLFADIVSSEGCLRQNVFELLSTARSLCSGLSQHLSMMPSQLKIHGLMINSSSLLSDCSVLPTQSPPVNHIAPHVNVYRTKCHVDIELSTLDYTPLCDPVELATFDLDDVIEVRGHRTNVVCVTASQSLPLTAVVYWFELKLADSVVVSTIDGRTHWTQAAVLFYDELTVETGAEYQLQTIYSDSCISVNVDRLP